MSTLYSIEGGHFADAVSTLIFTLCEKGDLDVKRWMRAGIGCLFAIILMAGCSPQGTVAIPSQQPSKATHTCADEQVGLNLAGAHVVLDNLESDAGEDQLTARDAVERIALFADPEGDYDLTVDSVIYYYEFVDEIDGAQCYVFSFGPGSETDFVVTRRFAVNCENGDVYEETSSGWNMIYGETSEELTDENGLVALSNENYTVTYTEMQGWHVNIEAFSDPEILICLENDTNVGDIVVTGDKIPATLSLQDYAQIKLTEIKEFYPGSDVSELYEMDGYNGEPWRFTRIVTNTGADLQVYFTVNGNIALQIACFTSGPYSDNMINEFEGVFLDNNFALIQY